MRNRSQGRNVFPQIHTVATATAIDKMGMASKLCPNFISANTKLTLVDHSTQHRQTTATCEAVGHDGYTNERCTQSCTLL